MIGYAPVWAAGQLVPGDRRGRALRGPIGSTSSSAKLQNEPTVRSMPFAIEADLRREASIQVPTAAAFTADQVRDPRAITTFEPICTGSLVRHAKPPKPMAD